MRERRYHGSPDMTAPRFAVLLCSLLLSACASGPPDVPFPAFIETDELDDVFESAVIGVPHRDFGEAVTAVVVPKPGRKPSEPAGRYA